MKTRSKEVGNKNIVGAKVVAIRQRRDIKQKELLARLQVLGLDMTEAGLSRLEGQHRLVHDFEIVVLAKALGVTYKDLLE